MEIGNANYNKGSSKKIEKIKDGSNIFRILPALGSMAKKGKWHRYMKIEWGHKDSKGNHRPFQDVRVVNNKTKMVEVESDAHLFREDLKAALTAAVDNFKAGKATKADVEAAKENVERFNLEKKFFVNAINVDGQIVLLKIGYKAMQALEAEIKKLTDTGIDPLSVNNGRFFNFYRSGMGFDTTYSVTVHKENINHPELGMVEKAIVHVLDQSIIDRLGAEATDLADLDKLYPEVTPQQVSTIIAKGPVGVDEALGVREDNNNKKEEKAAPAATQAAAAPAVTQVVSAAVVDVPNNTVATPAVVQAVQTEAAAPATQAVASAAKPELSKDEYLKSLGL